MFQEANLFATNLFAMVWHKCYTLVKEKNDACKKPANQCGFGKTVV